MAPHKLKIKLEPLHDSEPCHVSIKIKDSVVNQELNTNCEFEFDYEDSGWLYFEIHKTGKTKTLADKGHKQELIVSKVTLNGFNCYPELFGSFTIKDNPYVDDGTLNTTNCTLNGIWSINVPIWNLDGVNGFDLKSKMRDVAEDCVIATFGCSFTYGSFMDKTATWPAQLSTLTGKKVLNFGVQGSNNTEIIENALYIAKNYNVDDIMLLLCHFNRLQFKDAGGEIFNKAAEGVISTTLRMKWPKKFRHEMDKIVNYGQTELLFAGQSKTFLEKIKDIKNNINGKIYVSTYIQDHYKCLQMIQNEDFILLPFFELDKTKEMAPDGDHPGESHYRQFAKNVVKYMDRQYAV